MVRPEKWWIERSIIARSLIYIKKYETAYKIASKHGLFDGPEFAEAEWMSGWIAFSFLNDPLFAEEHFKRFYINVGYPISLSRGGYWLGKTYEKMGNTDESIKTDYLNFVLHASGRSHMVDLNKVTIEGDFAKEVWGNISRKL